MHIRLWVIFGFLSLIAFQTGYAEMYSNVGSEKSTTSSVITTKETMPHKGIRITMDFEEASLKDVLKAFSRQSGINFIASEDIEDKKVSVFMDNIGVEEALSSILEASNLTYDKKADNVYLIKPVEEIDTSKMKTKVFKLNYIQVYDMASQQVTGLTSGAFATGGETETAAAAEEAFLTTETAIQGSQKQSDIIAIIQSLMSSQGKIVADKRTNSLIITDFPDRLKSIEEAIKKLDVEPIQIMIEAEIIETTTDAIKRLGIEYGGSETLSTITWGQTTTTSGGTSSSEGKRLTVPTPFPLTENFAKDVLGASGVASSGLFTYGTLTVNDANIVLKAISTDSDTRYLSRPRIMTLNNEPAIIIATENTAIGTRTTEVSQTGSVTTEAEREITGVRLEVIPQVNENGDIFMHLRPSIKRVQASSLSSSFFDPQERGAESTVMVREGETVVIAGLIQTEKIGSVRKIPILGDIPLLGEVFRSRYKKDKDTEIIIFITPHIVRRRSEFIIPKELSEREFMIERALERYSKKYRRKL